MAAAATLEVSHPPSISQDPGRSSDDAIDTPLTTPLPSPSPTPSPLFRDGLKRPQGIRISGKNSPTPSYTKSALSPMSAYGPGSPGLRRSPQSTSSFSVPLPPILTADDAGADTPPDNGPLRTPLRRPSVATTIPAPEPLTNEQETMYNSVLNFVSTWTNIPVSTSLQAQTAPMIDEEQMWLSRECLLRYLRASKWVVHEATQRLLSTLSWRREYGLLGTNSEALAADPRAKRQQVELKLTAEYTEHENETGKQWILGFDTAGRPCLYLNPARQNTARSDKQIQHLVYMIERAVDLMPPGQETLALLINFAESSKGQGASLQQGKQTLAILQNHYPERLGRALLCNLPWHFWAFMKLVTPFIDPATRQKIVFSEDMRSHVPPEQLRKSHGGDLDFEYEHSEYWPQLVRLASTRRKEQYARWVRGGKRIGEYEAYLRGDPGARSLQDTINDRVEDQSLRAPDSGLLRRKKSVTIREHAKEASPPPTQPSLPSPPASPSTTTTSTEGESADKATSGSSDTLPPNATAESKRVSTSDTSPTTFTDASEVKPVKSETATPAIPIITEPSVEG